MKWSRAAVVAVMCVCTSTTSTKETKDGVVINCLQAGVAGRKTKLQCQAFGSTVTRMMWRQPSGYVAVSCNFKSGECAPADASTADLYRGVIDSPSRVTLVIKSFDPDKDGGKWWCAAEPIGEEASCLKRVDSGYDFFTGRADGGFIAVVLLGVLWAILLAAVIAVLIYKRRHKKKTADDQPIMEDNTVNAQEDGAVDEDNVNVIASPNLDAPSKLETDAKLEETDKMPEASAPFSLSSLFS